MALSLLLGIALGWACMRMDPAHAPGLGESSRTAKRSEASLSGYGAGDIITSMLLDRQGKLWMTTSNEGLLCYDGQAFARFTKADGLPGNALNGLLEDHQGNLWFGSDAGLCRFDGQHFSCTPLPAAGQTSDWLESVFPIVNPQAALSIHQNQDGTFWIGTNGAGAWHYDGQTFMQHLENEGKRMPDSLFHNVITSIVEDKQGHLWFGSFSHGGLSRYDGTGFVHHALNDGFGKGMISSAYRDRDGMLWFGTRNSGVHQYNGERFSQVLDAQGNEVVMAQFFQDSHGTLWASSYARKGVYRFNGTAFEPFNAAGSEKLLDIKCMAEDRNGHLWFGGRYGILWRYDGKQLLDHTDKH